MKSAKLALLVLPLSAALASCTKDGGAPVGLQSFHVRVVKVNGADPPDAESPLPANRGDRDDEWQFEIEARDAEDEPTSFDGLVRLTVEPGAIVSIDGEGAVGRNVRLVDGKGTATAMVTAVYGPARLWVSDLGYLPASPGETPACSNGENDDGADDVLVDYPIDPGCAFADDDSEEPGTFAIGVSPPVQYALPRLSDIQGGASETPYPYEGIQVMTDAPAQVVVTRVAKDGFYVTDLSQEQAGYNHLYAFNFSAPSRMRVCDRVTYLSGTVSEFFGFTELNFPSYQLEYPIESQDDCQVPEPFPLAPEVFSSKKVPDDTILEAHEAGLARLEGFRVATKFGPAPAVNNKFEEGQSSCDLNGDGQVDFDSEVEASCGNACSADPECSEWTSFSARGNFKVFDANGNMIQVETGSAPAFDPAAHKGEVLTSVTGILRNFSGGSLNWTLEVRCADDLVCDAGGCCAKDRCKGAPLSSKTACVSLRTIDDNDITSD